MQRTLLHNNINYWLAAGSQKQLVAKTNGYMCDDRFEGV